MVCFTFREPIDPTEPQEIIDAKLRDATVVEASRSFARYFGFENREEVLGQHLLKLYGGRIPDWFIHYGQEVEERHFEDIERVVKVPVGDNEVRPMRILMQNIFEDDKLVSQWITLRDVSREEERKRVIAENERLKTLALEAVGLRTFSLRLDLADQSHPRGQLAVGNGFVKDWWRRIYAEDRPELESAFLAFYNGESELMHTLCRVDGNSETERWMESWAIATQRNEAGHPEGVVGVIMDRTQSKALEAQMMTRHRLESLGVMAGGVAHDFNNLLLSITGSVDLLLDRYPSLADDLHVIDGASQQAAQLCEQLLTYAGRGAVELKPVDVAQVIDGSKELLAVSVHPNARLSFDIADSCWVLGDTGQLTQALMNLVRNASDSLEGEAGSIRISATLEAFDPNWRTEFHLGSTLQQQRYALLKVTDTGTGMSAEERERLFDPFFTTKFTGRGLGLAVAMGVVRGHHGAIRVESEIGSGTAMSILLPITAKADAEAVRQATDAPVDLSGCVMVVDDEESVRRIVTKLLSTLSIEAVVTDSGERAIELFRQEPERYRAILLDVSMPGMDGVAAASALLEEFPDTNIVLCSGYSNVAVPEDLANKVTFMQKPYRLWQLRDRLGPLSN